MEGEPRTSKHEYDVYSTMNYGRFKNLEGNREDIEKRAGKIKESVDAVGYVPAPIIVNERFEIIDGQARFHYCKAAGIPIVYMVVPRLTIDHCIAMNISSTNWNINDYIDSYAQRGFTAYKTLVDFLKESKYGLLETLWAALRSDGGEMRKRIISGSLKDEDIDAETGKRILDYWSRFDDIKSNRYSLFRQALGICFLMKNIDNEKLVKAAHKHPTSFMEIANAMHALRALEEAYNYGAKYENRIDFEHEYLDYLEQRFGLKVAAMAKAKLKKSNR